MAEVYVHVRKPTMQPSHVTTTRELAKQLLALEEVEETRAISDIVAVVRVCERVRRPLAQLAGSPGFHSLLARAMKLAKQECPVLCAWEVKPDGSLQGGEGTGEQGGEVLVSNLLRLMFTVIGESLTLQLLRKFGWNCLTPKQNWKGQNSNE